MNGIERRISEGRVGDIQCSDILKALNSGKTRQKKFLNAARHVADLVTLNESLGIYPLPIVHHERSTANTSSHAHHILRYSHRKSSAIVKSYPLRSAYSQSSRCLSELSIQFSEKNENWKVESETTHPVGCIELSGLGMF
jgi:hypothetical protein